MAPTATYCPRCAHYRMRPQPALFSAAEMQSTGGLKAQLEWEQQQQQLRLLEQQRVETAEVLPYEPHFYPWCAAASPFDPALLDAVDRADGAPDAMVDEIRKHAQASRAKADELIARAEKGDYEAVTELVESGGVTVNPVTGDVQRTYVLCRRVNRRTQCPLFDPREPS